MNFLRKIDLFGVPIKLKTPQKNGTFKTWIGGAMTIAIYSVSLIYATYVIYQWQSGALLPKISQQVTTKSRIDLPFDVLFNLSVSDIKESPFSSKNNILLPIFMQYTQTQDGLSGFTRYLFSDNKTISLEDVVLSMDSKLEQLNFFMLVPCKQQFLNKGSSCADQSVIDGFLANTRSALNLQLNIQQFDSQLQDYQQVAKTYTIVTEPEYRLLSTVSLSSTQVQYDSGLLLPSVSQRIILSDYSATNQAITYLYFQKLLSANYDPVYSIIFQIDKLQNVQTIVKPKLGEVLATIGSIFSILMMLRILGEAVSSFQLEKQIMNTILYTYFPNLQKVAIQRNILGKITRVTCEEKEIDVVSFEINYQKAIEQVQCYLELSKIIQKVIILEKKLQLEEKLDPISYIQNKTQIFPQDDQAGLKTDQQQDMSLIFK